jgi:hypothetical protein
MDGQKFLSEMIVANDEEIEREIDEEQLKFISGSSLPQIEQKKADYDEDRSNIDGIRSSIIG